tara:strand:+ start:613 stop:831 length:219 start_codon:yes stop_codon:yes gene_type:complete
LRVVVLLDQKILFSIEVVHKLLVLVVAEVVTIQVNLVMVLPEQVVEVVEVIQQLVTMLVVPVVLVLLFLDIK